MKRAWPVLILLFVCLHAAPAAAPKPQRAVVPNADATYINTLIANGDKDSLREAVICIGELIETQPTAAVYQARSSWLPVLLGAGYHDDVQRLAAMSMVEIAYDLPSLEEFQRLRIKAYLAAGQRDQALSAARSLFDLSSMANTRAAMTQVAECLSAANPLDPSVVNRLRVEQLAGAKAEDATSPYLLGIAVDTAPWQAGLVRYDPERYTIASNLYRNLVARGNLLLLSGRSADAQAVFERAKAAADDDSVLQANENIARAIKARHGCVGSANAFIRQLRGQ